MIVCAFHGAGRLLRDPFWQPDMVDKMIFQNHLAFASAILNMYGIWVVKLSIGVYLLALNFSPAYRYVIWVGYSTSQRDVKYLQGIGNPGILHDVQLHIARSPTFWIMSTARRSLGHADHGEEVLVSKNAFHSDMYAGGVQYRDGSCVRYCADRVHSVDKAEQEDTVECARRLPHVVAVGPSAYQLGM